MENEFAEKGRYRGQKNKEGAATLFFAREHDGLDWRTVRRMEKGKTPNEPKASGRPFPPKTWEPTKRRNQRRKDTSQEDRTLPISEDYT